MNVIASLVSVLAFAALLTHGAPAGAEPLVRSPTGGTRAPDYTEKDVAGDQVVTFAGDELSGLARGAYGDTIRRPPGIMRVGLIRPRMNFVSELLKSVESL